MTNAIVLIVCAGKTDIGLELARGFQPNRTWKMKYKSFRIDLDSETKYRTILCEIKQKSTVVRTTIGFGIYIY